MTLVRHLTSILILAAFTLFPSLLISTTHTDEKKLDVPTEPAVKSASVFGTTEEQEKWVDSVLNKMTIRERVAQMIMPWAGGNYTSESSKEYQRLNFLAHDLKVGGFIFFKGDILNEALLINKLQESADVPLLISSDFERGLAMRLTDATEFPYNMALAAANDPLLTREMGRIISLESRVLGIHQNYAPVADINNNSQNPIINIRSYSENKDVVSEYCREFIAGSVQGRMITTAKHFPGHGNTSADSHKELPVIGGTREEIMNNELKPFIESIKAGVQAIMIGHLSVPSLEPDNLPATLSKRIITDLLKGELGFKGLVITDAMNMNAVSRHYSVGLASVMAVKAGNDIILMPPDEQVAITAISDAVYSGEISIERINESVRKILEAKLWVGLDKNRTSDISRIPSFVGSKRNVFLANQIAEKSITLVKNDNNLIPVNPSKYYSTAVISISDEIANTSYFNDLVSAEFGYTRTISLNRYSTPKEYRKALQSASSSDFVFIPSYIKVKAYQGTITMSSKQVDFINSVLSLAKPTAIISFGNPYLLTLFPDAPVYLAAYGDALISQQAVLRAITGKADITGKLPISIPNTNFIIGDGITISRNLLVKDSEGYDFFDAEEILAKEMRADIISASSMAVISKGKLIVNKCFGKTDFSETAPGINNDYIFDTGDLLSLVAAAGALILKSEGALDFNRPVSYYLPGDNTGVFVRDIIAGNIFNPTAADKEPAAKTSQGSLVLLKEIIEKISGSSLDIFLQNRLFNPLGMKRTFLNPPKELWFFTIPSDKDIYKYRRNNFSGPLVLFSDGEDLSVFMQMLIQKGKYGKEQLISEDAISSWYGTDNNELFISSDTGCAVWMNPSMKLSVVFLSNASYNKKTSALQKEFPALYSSIKNSIEY